MRRLAKLKRIWAQVPKMIDCKGLCHTSCGPVPMSKAEERELERAGHEVPNPTAMFATGCLRCPHLTAQKRCAVYDLRPLICRLWGATKMMPCTYGCEPERMLSEAETSQLLRDAERLTPEAKPLKETGLAILQATQGEACGAASRDFIKSIMRDIAQGLGYPRAGADYEGGGLGGQVREAQRKGGAQ